MTDKNKKIRVLVVSTSGVAISNGIATNMYNYLSHIVGEDVEADVAICHSSDEKMKEKFRRIGCGIIDMPHRRKQSLKEYLMMLRRLCRNSGYDAVHFHTNSHTITLDLIATWSGNPRVVRMVHAHNTTCDHVVVHRLLSPLFNMFCQVRLACGEAAGRWMYGNHKFAVITNGVDIEKFAFNIVQREWFRKKWGWEQCRVIGHVGRFTQEKNHKFVIAVFREMYRRDTGCRFVLIGDGPLLPEIKQQVKDYGLVDMAHFTGAVTNVHEYLSALDLVLMPSLYEGLPLTLIEQQTNGLRCIISDTISNEVNKTGNISFLPLTAPTTLWAEKALAITPDNYEERTKRCRQAIADITKAGYSIQMEAGKLKRIYVGKGLAD